MRNSPYHRFRNNLYYRLKPIIPTAVRIALRKRIALQIRDRVSNIWPIMPGSAVPPKDWPGWPDDKGFAFVLTHDVEGKRGLERVRQLAEVEIEFGFRSSFNFIPEGGYETPHELREWLNTKGFEVGVHDLHHDGKLYDSRNGFARKAQRINNCLRKWGAVGFRSGFMMHHLDWIHQLELDYDASTFDVDPFEPEPDGVNTIFPFWVPAPSAHVQAPEADSHRANEAPSECKHANLGYVEIPYTLPQDSTLFLFLRETTIDVWKKKLDWIAESGGMALLNVHPDYVNFDGGVNDGIEYPVEHYREFLRYVKERYSRDSWNTLPREVARYCRGIRPVRATRNVKNIAMLAYTDYAADARVVRYAQTLAKRGDQVDVIACSSRTGSLEMEEADGVKVYKLLRRRQKRQEGPISHLWPLLLFFVKAAIFTTRKHFERPYDLIHVHNIPEWLVFAVCLPRLLGARVLLDVHDLVPELFEAKFKKGESSLVGPALRVIERLSCRFSDHVIISNHLWRDRLVKRSVPAEKCSVFFNNIDPDLFQPHLRTRHDDRRIVLFPGTLQWHQGVDIAIRAFPYVLARVPSAEFHIYGGRGVVDELKDLVSELGLQTKVLFFEPVAIKQIPQLIADADLGVVPKRADSFGNEAYSTKIMEFMSQGVPVVVSRTAVDSYYFNENQVRFCESGSVQAFAEAMVEVLTDQDFRLRLVDHACEYVARNHWGSRRQDYLKLVDGLIGGVDCSIRATARSVETGIHWITPNHGTAATLSTNLWPVTS